MILVVICSLALASSAALAGVPDVVEIYRDGKGWKLKVNGHDFYVKGVVWGYTPRGENYKFNLWLQPDEQIRAVLDHDFGLMKQAGVNAIRSFATIPPEWVTYINDRYGIKTVINPLMGRYGALIGGKWVENPDYSDPLTRKTLKEEVLRTVRKYKDVPGVLMFALGNESNYGLSWSSFEIENLPEGEREVAKAKYLYSLFAETIAEGKRIDPNHPFTIVNGDIQYIDLIAKQGKDWDLLGVNAYRGSSFTTLWKDVKTKLNLPVLMFEFGSDAFNAVDMAEDQYSQASYLKSQWQEMYNNAYGHGYGNSLGGFVFEWRDEWWKYKIVEQANLDKHDTNASWENGGYKFDYVQGQHNMNEEWFGITRLGEINDEGVYVAEPRLAYDVLARVWAIDPFSETDIDSRINAIDLDALEERVAARDAENGWGEKNRFFRFVGGEVKLDYIATGYDGVRPDPAGGAGGDPAGKKTKNSFGEMAFLDFEFEPISNLSGDFTINVIGDATDSDFEFKYGDRMIDKGLRHGGRHVELYDFQASLRTHAFDLNAFYHVPRYHWGEKGDFFGLLRETTDMDGPNGEDIWNAKAPYGLEFVGKQELDGLTVVGGPEIYWGANPKVLVKYQFGKEKQYAILHSHDLKEAESGSGSPTSTTSRKSSQTTLQGKFTLSPRARLEIGGIFSNPEKIGETYDYIDSGQVYVDKIKLKDTLGLKAKLSYDLSETANAYGVFSYAGLVADGGAPRVEYGTGLPYTGKGNKVEFEAGVRLTYGDYTVFPRALWRDNLIDANPLILPYIVGTTLYPGINPRNDNNDPFSVLDNRAVRSAEVILTYDPTPGTPFYEWDNDFREDAELAYNVGLTVSRYISAADSALFHYDVTDTDVPFGRGLPAATVWALKSKLVMNPSKTLKALVNVEVARQQPTGVPVEPDGTTPVKPAEYLSVDGKLILHKRNIFSASFKKDGFGPYDFQREFNVRYPKQVRLGYVRLLDVGKGEKDSTRIGVRVLYRTLNQYSTEYLAGLNDYMYELQSYFIYKF